LSGIDSNEIDGINMKDTIFHFRKFSRDGNHVKLIKELAKGTVMMGAKRACRVGLLTVGWLRLTV